MSAPFWVGGAEGIGSLGGVGTSVGSFPCETPPVDAMVLAPGVLLIACAAFAARTDARLPSTSGGCAGRRDACQAVAA
eukprot:5187996-Alexandrium_andersonii.AAC.1